MAAMVLQMNSSSSVLSTPPPTPPMENPANYPSVHQKRMASGAATPSSNDPRKTSVPVTGNTSKGLQVQMTRNSSEIKPAVTLNNPMHLAQQEDLPEDVLTSSDTSLDDTNVPISGTKNATAQNNTSQVLLNGKNIPKCDLKEPDQPPAHSQLSRQPQPPGTDQPPVHGQPSVNHGQPPVHGQQSVHPGQPPFPIQPPGPDKPRQSLPKKRSMAAGAPKSLLNPEDYFRGVSPMCRRLLEDMAAVRESMGRDWAALTYEQQCKILDQAIVDEATMRRYEHEDACAGPECAYFPKLQLRTGQRIVRDEKLSERGYTCSWRDEHSAPFSWHTRSQMDLTLDTPPETPLEPPYLPHELDQQDVRASSKDNQSSKSPSFTSRSQKRPHQSRRTRSAFTWHYEPSPRPPKSNSTEIPDIVRDSSLQIKTHVVVRAENTDGGNAGFLDKLRGAFCKLTTSCMPTQNSSVSQSLQSSTSTPPDLRPAHVLAQAKESQNTSLPITMPVTSRSHDGDHEIFSKSNNEHANTDDEIRSRGESYFGDRNEIDGHFRVDDVVNSVNNNHSGPNSLAQDVGSIAPTTNITANPLSVTCNSSNKPDNGNKPTGFNRPQNKRRAPEPVKKPAPAPPVRHPSTHVENNRSFPLLKDEDIVEKNGGVQEKNLNLLNATNTQGHHEILDNDDAAQKSFENFMDGTTLEDKPSVDLSTSGQDFIPKTGFDFLDNW